MLPETAALLEIPEGTRIQVTVLENAFEEIEQIHALPTPTIDEDATQDGVITRYLEKKDVYQKDAFLPLKLAEYTGDGRLRSRRIARIQLNPVQYNPVQKKLRVYHQLKIRIVFSADVAAPETSPPAKTPDAFQQFDRYLSLRQPHIHSQTNVTTSQTKTEWYNPDFTYLKLFVKENGIYSISFDELVRAGLTPGFLNRDKIKIFNHGEQIPLWIDGPENQQLDAGNVIYFYGERHQNDSTYYDFYSDTNVYWLTADGEQGLRYQLQNTSNPTAATATFYDNDLHLEQENLFHRSNGTTAIDPGERWVWRYLFPDQHEMFNFEVNGLVTNAKVCTLRIRLQGTTSDPASPDHHVSVHLNQTQVADAFFDEREELILQTAFPASLLKNGLNKFDLHLVPDTGAEVNQIYLDWVEIIYPRTFAAASSQLNFQSGPREGTTEFSLFNFRDSHLQIFSPSERKIWQPQQEKRSVYHIESAGFDDGNSVSADIDFQHYGGQSRGHHLFVIDRQTGVVEHRNFDTFASQDDAEAMAEFINQLPENTVVLAGIVDEGSSSMTENAYLALEFLGSTMTRQVGFRDSWSLIGRKGAAAGTVTESLNKHFSGTAVADTILTGESAFRFGADFQDTLPTKKTYIAVSDSGVKQLAKIEIEKTSRLKDGANGADYIIITHKNFKAQAQQLADYRAGHNGFRTAVVDVEDVYDEFNFGIRHPQAIKDFLKYTFENWQAPAPTFVVLFGDASWDPKKNMPESVKTNFVPSYGILVSDNWYVSLDGPNDVLPDMFIGRIPVETAQQADAVVQKIIAYEQLPYAAWNKKFMFMDGGINSVEQTIFRSQANALIQQQIDVAPFYGLPFQFNKTTQEAITQNLRRDASEKINQGVLWVNFLGHAASTVWDIDIGQPDEWQNTTIFPFMTGMSCHSARFANPALSSLSEDYFVNPIGACGYWGSSGFGFITQDFFLLEGLFSAVTLDTVRSLGEATTAAKFHLWQVFGNASRTRRTINQYVLMGDPALNLDIPKKPELALSPQDISFSSQLLLLSDSTTTVTAAVHNYGYAPQDSTVIAFSVVNPDASNSRIDATTSAPFDNSDSVSVLWKLQNTPGEYRIQVQIDPDNRIDEEDKTNNFAQTDVHVFASDLTLIKPIEFGVIHTSKPVLVTTNSQADFKNLTYIFEVDTSFSFQSNFYQTSGPLPEGDLVTTWKPKLSAPGIYHWRVRTFNGQTFGPWANSSFKYTTEQAAWQQSTALQFDQNSLNQTETKTTVGVGLKLNKTTYEVQSAGLTDGNLTAIFIDNKNVAQSSRGHNLAVFDERDGSFIEFRNFDTWKDAANAEAMAAYINALPSGRIVVAGIKDDGSGSMTENAYLALESIGSELTRQVGFRDAWAIIGQKGAATGSVPEAWNPAGEGPVAVTDTLNRFAKFGSILSTPIGPAISWKSAKFQFLPGTENDYLTFSILGKQRETAKVDTLFGNIASSESVNLTAVDASVYPTIQLQANFSSENGLQSPTLTAWAVDFEQAPDLITGRGAITFTADTVLVGNDIQLELTYGNFGFTATDSFTIQFTTSNKNGTQTAVQHVSVPGVKPDSYKRVNVFLPTNHLSGKISLAAHLDILNEIPELNETNNDFKSYFWVAADTVKPEIRMTIDGRTTTVDDFVSANPEIIIEIHEQSNWSLADSSRLTLILDGQNVHFGTAANEAEFIPQIDPQNDLRALLIYRPFLDEGDHRLEVLAKDISENLGYVEQTFMVSSEFLIANVMNYPNPFSETTEFTYILTQPSDEVKIKIYTVAGRLIRELEFLPSSVGFNSFLWNGRDHDKDFLANGVYLYKIIARKGDQQIEVIDKFVVMR